MNKYILQKIVLILFCLVYSASAYAISIQNRSNNNNFELPQLTHNIVIDGKIDEPAWQKAITFELDVETRPGENIKAPVRTTVYMFDDGESLFLAFKAYDPDPSQIRARFHDHDLLFGDDIVGFKLDTYNDAVYAYQFFVNALGVKHDSIENDAIRQDDPSWDAIWDAAGLLTKQGYQVEFSIPLRILRYDDSKIPQKWGFDLLRFYPRDVTHRISHQKLDRNISCTLCQNATITGLKDIEMGNNLTVVPFMTATQQQQRDYPTIQQWQDSGVATEFGADFRWGITPDTTLNATLNPDFSQIESDVAQLDINNTFSLFFPEKRPFFVEGSEYYKSLINLVYTRNISDPDYGMKLTHTSDGDNYAAFLSNDTVTNYILPGSSSSSIASFDSDSINGVFRYRRDLDNTSSIGVIGTLREATGYHNYVYGIDGSFRITDTDVLRAQILQSDTEDPEQIINEFSRTKRSSSGSAVDVHYKHKDRDWIIWGRYTRLAEGFRADLGFQPRVDYNRYVTGFRRFWYEKNDHWWHTLTAGIDSRNNYDLNGQLLQQWINGTISYKGPMQSEIEFTTSSGEQYWDGRVYNNDASALFTQLTPMSGLRLRLFVKKQQSIDYANSQPADLFSLSPSIIWNIGQHFQAEFRYTRQSLDVNDGELFTSSLLDARLIYQFSVQSFLRLIIQYNDTVRNQSLYIDAVDANSRDLGVQLLYSYKFNTQTVFFLGYSDSAFEDDRFNQLEKTNKTLFLKMSYSWLQ